jgi:hypothetical protein
MRRVFVSLSAVGIAVVMTTPFALAQNAMIPLATLKASYKQSLDVYRSSEDQFYIASQQYYQLRTLSSQSEAVKAARQVMLNRADTLLVYLQMLQTALATNPGIEITRRNAVDNQITLLVDALKRHRSRVEIATDRIIIEQEAAFMDATQPTFTQVSYQALSLIKIGAVQAAVDQLTLAQSALVSYISTAPISETNRTEKERGNDEITRSLTEMKNTITDALLAYDQSVDNTDSSSFHSIQQTLGTAYGNLTQNLEYIKELSQ